MPPGLIHHEHRVRTGRELTGKVFQEDRYRVGTHLRQSQCEPLVRARLAGGEQRQALETLIDHPQWTHPTLIPDPCRPTLLAQARLVLAPELQTRLRMLRREG